MNNEERYFATIKEYNENINAPKMLITALKEIAPVKGNRLGFIISLVLGVIVAIGISGAPNTVESIAEILFETLLIIFGLIFILYLLLLTFLRDSYLKKTAKIEYTNGISYLKTSTTYYESAMFLYLFALGITGVLLLFLKCIEPAFLSTSKGLTCVLLSLYFSFTFRVVYELKSTIYNTIVLLRANIAYRLLALSKDEIEGQIDDNDLKMEVD